MPAHTDPSSTAPSRTHAGPAAETLSALIIGSGFGGLGMAIALRKQGISDFLLLEKAHDVGGVWRDNTYPGAACDVPSHLYSFSFEPNPNWSRHFAQQPEILAYLQHCARKYQVLPHLRFGAEVREARFDEAAQRWRVTLQNGETLHSRLLISATGQLSRPLLPRIEGIDTFGGPAFHSARWNHGCALQAKRVAVIGTGASALQFVPAIAGQVAQLSVFQRSPAYILPRPDHAYSADAQARFAAQPWRMRLHRAGIYLHHEVRALGFTRFRSLLQPAVGRPFRQLLREQVPDPALRRQLTPDYPIGCKRILLSSDYLATLARPNVALVGTPIRRIVPEGVETEDGTLHRADVLIYGTGFAATEFLAPMRITGRDGIDLNTVWQDGASAYLGMTVPGFPNFFMLYGPNTNLGHSSIVYMLESQIAHVMRCLKALRGSGASAIEVDAERYHRHERRVQQALQHTAWQGCQSWYLDARGRNSTNWPGFTLGYRWRTRWSSLQAYRFTQPIPGLSSAERVLQPGSPLEDLHAAFLRGFLRLCFRGLIGPPHGIDFQRRIIALLGPLTPGVRGIRRERASLGGIPAERLARRDGFSGDHPVPVHGAAQKPAPRHGPFAAEATPHGDSPPGALLYLHGGAFCIGGPDSHRSIGSRLAVYSGLTTWMLDYRLAPEHPYPAALEDALAAWQALLDQGLQAQQIVVAGDSAGGMLALALLLRLRAQAQPLPAGLMLLSPVTDPSFSGPSMQTHAARDPMLHHDWLQQAVRWYACPPEALDHRPLEAGLQDFPPLLLQVGEDEVLLSDAQRLAELARRDGVPCQYEQYAGRWHVFQLQAFQLASARHALRRLGAFARAVVQPSANQPSAPPPAAADSHDRPDGAPHASVPPPCTAPGPAPSP